MANQPNPYDSSLSQYDYNPAQMVQGAETSLDIPSILAQVIGATVKALPTPAMGGMSAGAQYSSGDTPGVTSGLDEYQQSLGKGKSPSGTEQVGFGRSQIPYRDYSASGAQADNFGQEF